MAVDLAVVSMSRKNGGGARIFECVGGGGEGQATKNSGRAPLNDNANCENLYRKRHSENTHSVFLRT